MEESKLQALHDSLSQLRKTQGLGASAQYSWQRGNASKEETNRHQHGLPNNALYSNFVPSGTYDPAAPNHGDGRTIKRDFSDCLPQSQDSKVSKKLKRKAEKKAARKAAKKLKKKMLLKREKKREKLRAKRAMKKLASAVSSNLTIEEETKTDKKEKKKKSSKKDR